MERAPHFKTEHFILYAIYYEQNAIVQVRLFDMLELVVLDITNVVLDILVTGLRVIASKAPRTIKCKTS